MTTEDQLRKYIYEISAGALDPSRLQIREILSIALGDKIKKDCANVVILIFDITFNDYQPYRTVKTTDDRINIEIKKALETRPIPDKYWYKCYNCAGEFQGAIYSDNNKIFNE